MIMVPQTTVARWFKKDIGKANGILWLGAGIGGTLVPLTVIIIDSYGWQNTLLILEIGMLVIGLLLSLVFRNRPEDYGLLPDGKIQVDANKSGNSTISEDISVLAKRAIKTRVF